MKVNLFFLFIWLPRAEFWGTFWESQVGKFLDVIHITTIFSFVFHYFKTKSRPKLVVHYCCISQIRQKENRKNSSSSSSSSGRTISTDISNLFSPPLSIIHCFQQVFRATSCIGTELLYVGSSWSSCLCSSMWRGPQEYVTHEFVPTSPAVSYMSGLSNLDNFRDGW